MSSDVDEILEYWFGPEKDINVTILNQSQLWWGKNIDADIDIKKNALVKFTS